MKDVYTVCTVEPHANTRPTYHYTAYRNESKTEAEALARKVWDNLPEQARHRVGVYVVKLHPTNPEFNEMIKGFTAYDWNAIQTAE